MLVQLSNKVLIKGVASICEVHIKTKALWETNKIKLAKWPQETAILVEHPEWVA